jgi:peptide/nickel transport system substrate-binding protein
MDALIDGARAAAAVGDNVKYVPDVKGFISKAYHDVPRVPLLQPYLNVATQANISGYSYWFHRQVDYRSIVKA